MKKIFGFVFAVLLVVSLAYAPAAFADIQKGKDLFNKGRKEGKKIIITACKTCHKAAGDPTKFKPVGPGLKGEGKKYTRERLKIWLSPNNVDIWNADGEVVTVKGKIIGVPKDPILLDIMARYKAQQKDGKDMKKSQMVKNFRGGKPNKKFPEGKPPKITLTEEEQGHLIDYVLTL